MDCSMPGLPIQASLSITNSQSSLRLTSIESVMPSNHLILCRPLLLLPSIFPSIRGFPNESVLRIRWLKYWSVEKVLRIPAYRFLRRQVSWSYISSITKVYIQVSYNLILLLGEVVLTHTTRATPSIQEAVQKKRACPGISVMPRSLWFPWTVACQAPLSMEFSLQEHWSELPCSLPGDLPNPGIYWRKRTKKSYRNVDASNSRIEKLTENILK